ncbi:MAG TPA: cytochrome b/b6 domain-containing protein [Symbiobacteriaceae bacterium]|jgi:cytochrome b subunit of formate dehydrogenase
MSSSKPVYYQRWNLQHRLQHITLVISMIGLLWSGLAIKFHYTAWAQFTFRFFSGFHATLIVHKLSATLLIVVAVWHLAFLLKNWDPNWKKWAMMPTLNDFRDAGHHMQYLLQKRTKPPEYDRYTYLEKFEYLAIFWGMVAMGATGLSLWFPEIAGHLVPRSFLDAFRIVHANEAVVAIITLAYGHFFTAHLNPGVFPSSPVWYNGKLPLEHMLEEHPLEYQRLVEKGELPLIERHEHKLPFWRKGLAAIELIIYSAVFYYLLITFLPKAIA